MPRSAAFPDAISQNMSFLLAELDGQLSRLIAYFEAPHSESATQLMQRAGYSSNLAGGCARLASPRCCTERLTRHKGFACRA